MIEPGFYLGDCMDYLREMPDKCIDLAIVDPPYGDALQMGGGWQRFGGRFDRYKKPTPTGSELPQPGRDMASCELAAEPTDTRRQKNCRVGRRAETRLF